MKSKPALLIAVLIILGGVAYQSGLIKIGSDYTEEASEYLRSTCWLSSGFHDNYVEDCKKRTQLQMIEFNRISNEVEKMEYLAGVCLRHFKKVHLSLDIENEVRKIEGKEPYPPRLLCQKDVLEKLGIRKFD